MKHVILIAVFLCTAWLGQQVYAQQGFGTNDPDKSAAVDIVSTKRGLLIPRVALTAINSNALVGGGQINNPANSLFVYNTNTTTTGTNDVTPGYYYWLRDDPDATGPTAWQGKWVRFVSSEDMKTTSVAAGQNIKVDTLASGNNTEYTVSVQGSDTEGQVLVTGPGGTTVWVDPAVFVNDAIVVGNGLTKNAADSNRVELGGALSRATEIDVNGHSLAITGLDTVATPNVVMVLGPGGVLQAAELSSFVKANNGLNIQPDGNIQLGGALLQDTTTIGSSVGQRLAITGLQGIDAANKIVVAEDDGGVLRTVTRSLSGTIADNTTVAAAVTDYSPYVQEINLTAQLGGSDWTLTLPEATAANNGQVINVKITNTTDAHDGYLNIVDHNTSLLTYGSLPYQGWVLKSNGSSWLIVGRN